MHERLPFRLPRGYPLVVATDEDEEEDAGTDFRAWARLLGRWDLQDGSALYSPPDDKEASAVGTILAPDQMRGGILTVTARFVAGEETLPQARIIFGWDPLTKRHYSAGFGGWNALYSVEAFSSSPTASGYAPIALLVTPRTSTATRITR